MLQDMFWAFLLCWTFKALPIDAVFLVILLLRRHPWLVAPCFTTAHAGRLGLRRGHSRAPGATKEELCSRNIK